MFYLISRLRKFYKTSIIQSHLLGLYSDKCRRHQTFPTVPHLTHLEPVFFSQEESGFCKAPVWAKRPPSASSPEPQQSHQPPCPDDPTVTHSFLTVCWVPGTDDRKPLGPEYVVPPKGLYSNCLDPALVK